MLRRRNVAPPVEAQPDYSKEKDAEVVPPVVRMENGSFWLTRIVMLRYVAFIFCVAFLVALHQNRALIGKNGLLPANQVLDSIKHSHGDETLTLLQVAPTILWFFNYRDNIDVLLDGLAYVGLALSAFVLIWGAGNIPMILIVWIIYHSIVNVGQRWYSFGWESQMLETAFLTAFLCPLLSIERLPKKSPPSFIVLFGYRWLIFRIMLGAGLIKIRGDKCWRDLTCMNYHYETQPVPNPISYYMHQEPELFHKLETSVNHFVELLAPFLLLLPRPFCIIGGIIQILFQVVLIISGNLSFLNWLTIVPSIACFDDKSLQWLFPSSFSDLKHRVIILQQERKSGGSIRELGSYIRTVFNVSLGVLLAYLSIPILKNLMSSRQVMNTSFDSLRIVNTYGAFGSITKERTEVIFQGTYAKDPHDPKAKWLEYEFKCKPGNVTRRPCLISPYHYRLDWLMWFAAFQNYNHNPWLIHLGIKFLTNDQDAVSLISHNPFEGRQPPRWIRAEHYRYIFTKIGSKDAQKGAWWKRRRIGNYLPPISLDSIRDLVKKMHWPMPRVDVHS